MPVTKLAAHSTSLIFKAIQEMVQGQGFKWNDDISDTDTGKSKHKEFKLFLTDVENSDRSNRQKYRVKGTFVVTLIHNAQNGTTKALTRCMEDAENIIFDIERFAPVRFTEAKRLIEVSHFINTTFDPLKTGDDSKIKSAITFEITYKINNPQAI